MLSSNGTLIPNIILDSVGISFCIIGMCQTLIYIILIIIRRRFIKLKDRILSLLSLNMYICIFIAIVFFLNVFISMLRGHLHPNIPETNFNTWSCLLIIYMSSATIASTLYSVVLQALYRFFRIVYYNRPIFYQNVYVYILGIFIQIFSSALQPLPILLAGAFQYEDYHCQIFLTNWRGLLMGVFLIWLSPVSVTAITYGYTIRYIRRHTTSFTGLQQTRIKRDFTVIRRVLWLVMFILAFGIPPCSLAIVYYLFGYIGWWANYVVWITYVLSFLGVSVLQTYYSPHLRILWTRTPN